MGTLFDSIKQGLNEAIQHQKGEQLNAKIHSIEALDVKAISSQTGLTQESFAARFGVSLGRLRHGNGVIGNYMGRRGRCCR